MCGIAGVAGDVRAEDRAATRAMCQAMRHRGPDDEGFLDADDVCLGMRRLAIIDVDHGQQPVFDESGSVAAVFNGEIYNFHQLQAQLRARGHHLASGSDSECLPHLYEEAGTDMFAQLRGMFAIAIWDADRQRLTLARDRVGKKPLYYRVDGPRIWFASELKCLLALPTTPLDIDPVAIDHYLTYQYVPQPWSVLKAVRKLPPGHTLTWQRGRVSIQPYWRLHYAPPGTRAADPRELAEELREGILEATRIRMESERPMGAFLSGGVDSSAVVAAMAQSSATPVSTFSIGFAEEDYNELPHARRVAELYGTNHRELTITPDIEDILPRIARMFDEPFADSSAIPSYYVAEMARRDVVVVLNGDGGDESFGGYSRYAHFLATSASREQIPRPAARAAGSLGGALAARQPQSRTLQRAAGRLAVMGLVEPYQRYTHQVSYFPEWEKAGLYRGEFARSIAGSRSSDLTRSAWIAAGDTDDTNRLLACDVALYLPGDLLPKVDITTMAVSLEARSPLLDHELMEWAARLPGSLKVRDGTTKWILKEAMRPWLPADLIDRPKMGFAIPREEWLRGTLRPMVHDLLLSPSSYLSAYLRPARIRALVEQNDAFGTAGPRVWALLMLELWHREVQHA